LRIQRIQNQLKLTVGGALLVGLSGLTQYKPGIDDCRPNSACRGVDCGERLLCAGKTHIYAVHDVVEVGYRGQLPLQRNGKAAIVADPSKVLGHLSGTELSLQVGKLRLQTVDHRGLKERVCDAGDTHAATACSKVLNI